MKTTLENSYCRPQNEAEWKLIGLYNPVQPFFVEYIKGKKRYSSRPKSSKNEIPVQHFIDLVEDGICAWRLEEVGFVPTVLETCNSHHLKLDNGVMVEITEGLYVSAIEVNEDGEIDHMLFQGVKTFTDLQTLIRFLK